MEAETGSVGEVSMGKYEGNIEVVHRSAKTIFDFLSDFRHFEKFLPEQISGWEANVDYCMFSVQGIGKMKLAYTTREPDKKIVIQPAPESGFPFPFYLTTYISQDSNNPSKAAFQFVVETELNPMIAMMVDKPLKQFVEIITLRLKTYLNEEHP